MSSLWIIFAVALVLAALIDNRDITFRLNGYQKRDRLLTFALLLMLAFFCGLRTWGNDTPTYRMMFEQMPLWDNYWEETTYTYSGGIGFGILTSIIKTMGFSSQDYLMFYAFLTVIPYVLFVRKYSKTLLFGIFLMFVTGFYTFSLAAIKQSMATGLCLLAVDSAIEKKWIRYGIFMFLACMFHPYALVYLLVPFVFFKPWTKYTFIFMGFSILASIYLESLLGTVLDVTDMMGAEYDETSFTGEGVNIFRVMVSFVPLILASFYGKNLFKNFTRAEDLLFNLAMLNALIMFVGLFGTANYFARLANYFLPAQVVILPAVLARFHQKEKQWLVPLCILGYLGYFYYENNIIRPFATSYTHMSLWDYLSTLF